MKNKDIVKVVEESEYYGLVGVIDDDDFDNDSRVIVFFESLDVHVLFRVKQLELFEPVIEATKTIGNIIYVDFKRTA